MIGSCSWRKKTAVKSGPVLRYESERRGESLLPGAGTGCQRRMAQKEQTRQLIIAVDHLDRR